MYWGTYEALYCPVGTSWITKSDHPNSASFCPNSGSCDNYVMIGGGNDVTENDVTGPHVTGSDPQVMSFTGSHLEGAVEGL